MPTVRTVKSSKLMTRRSTSHTESAQNGASSCSGAASGGTIAPGPHRVRRRVVCDVVEGNRSQLLTMDNRSDLYEMRDVECGMTLEGVPWWCTESQLTAFLRKYGDIHVSLPVACVSRSDKPLRSYATTPMKSTGAQKALCALCGTSHSRAARHWPH